MFYYTNIILHNFCLGLNCLYYNIFISWIRVSQIAEFIEPQANSRGKVLSDNSRFC